MNGTVHMMEMSLTLNGERRSVWVKTNETLLSVLRNKLGIKSPKEGCGRGDCGACTVLLNGKAVRSCLILAIEVAGQTVVTTEGVGREGPSALQKAFVEDNAFQCGFCASGMVLAASALLAENPDPSEAEVREALAGNLCRCTGYEPIVNTVLKVARQTGKKAKSRKSAKGRK